MKLLALTIVALLVLGAHTTLTFSSFNGQFSSEDTSSLSLADLVTVANYYGCHKWSHEQCLECSQGYYFNNKGVCCEVDPLCAQFNRAEGVCQRCYQGYSIADGLCVQSESDVGCKRWNGDTCLECSRRWYFNSQRVCVPVADQCATWSSSGACLTCYGGYRLSNGRCLIDNTSDPAEENPLCAKWDLDNGRCLKCAQRAFFDGFGLCWAVNDQCQTFDPIDGYCLSCYGGYRLEEGKCIISEVTGPSDPGCNLWNQANDVCLKCSQRHYFDIFQRCQPVDDLCADWNNLGDCTSCYDGYDLQSGRCVISTRNERPSDVGCGTWDWANQVCLKCSVKWVFNRNRVCVPVSDQCNTHNDLGLCTSCYQGYVLSNGQCIKAELQEVSDQGCKVWDWSHNCCRECAKGWVLNDFMQCSRVSDLCKTHNDAGFCTSCYDGYELRLGACHIKEDERVTDVGCGTWDWVNQVCLKCSLNWVFNRNRVCVPVSDQCESHNQAGNCTRCYEGYELVSGSCQLEEVERVGDVGCATWDWKKRLCLQCSVRWTFNSRGICVPVSDQCRTHNSQGACLTCYEGYKLQGAVCVKKADERVKDVGCSLWDWSQQVCLQCSQRWVFNSQGRCIPVSDQCKTANSVGDCTSCYKGYRLSGGQCVETIVSRVSDLGCAEWDWDQQRCKKCSFKWVFNGRGECIPVSDQCKDHDSFGRCTDCYKGYRLVSGRCELAPEQNVSDVGCATWDWENQICLKCSNRFVFNSNRQCTPVSDNCKTYNSTGLCTSCYGGYLLNQGRCEMGNSLCKESDQFGACTVCYQGYLLNQGSCVPLSKLANLALYYSMCCPEKLEELNMQIGSRNNQ